MIKHLVHKGTCVGVESTDGTAATILEEGGGTAAEIAYLEVREHCANPGCDGGGVKRCAVCKQIRYCGKLCQVAHWPEHKVACSFPNWPVHKVLDAAEEANARARTLLAQTGLDLERATTLLARIRTT
jgi:hypothetical protein